MLPHLFQQKRYRDFYLERSRKDDYIILDNGAAEGFDFGTKHLYYVAEGLGAHEIVVPDTLGDQNDTIAKGLAFSRYTRPGYRYMMVAQGKNVTECMQSIDMIATDSKFAYVTTVGIPRLIAQTDLHARFKVAKFIAQRGYDAALEYHFLGSTKDLREIGYLNETGVARGMDTSAPIYMGLKGHLIDSYPWYPRPRDFFTQSRDHKAVADNIAIYLDWAGYKSTEPLPDHA